MRRGRSWHAVIVRRRNALVALVEELTRDLSVLVRNDDLSATVAACELLGVHDRIRRVRLISETLRSSRSNTFQPPSMLRTQ
jgi:hypothetical protein